MTTKNTQADKILSAFKITGRTASGNKQKLDTEVKVQSPKLNIEAEQEYILINKLNKAGVEIKARFIDEELPTDKAKFLFMLGETCYGAAFKFYEGVPKEIATKEQKEKMFKNFMQELTETVLTYRRLTNDKKRN
jgi:hypothetical protein